MGWNFYRNINILLPKEGCNLRKSSPKKSHVIGQQRACMTAEVLTTEGRVSIAYPCPLGYITYTRLRYSSHS